MSLGSHQTTVGASQVHLTPRWIIDRLGPFDTDPSAADPRPWDCATTNYTEADDGLAQTWHGRVWLNPPFHRYTVGAWIARLAQHGQGTALLHARTEAAWFRPVWGSAILILFLSRRLKFCKSCGTEHRANSGAPPVLVAFGVHDAERLRASGIAGAYVDGWRVGA
jgi:hypothetical protein